MQNNKKKQFFIGGLILILFAVSLLIRPSEPEKAPAPSFDKGYVAVIRAEGPIVGSAGMPGLLGGSTGASSDRLMRDFRRALNDPNAKAVLLRINSPGGSATATQEIGAEMDRVREAGKKIIVSMGDSCASGGYWLAAKGDYIFANPSTLTGSIGVYIGYTNYQELMDKLGIKNDMVKSGEHKDILSPDRPMTEEERILIQGMVDDIYEQFLDVVATGREMDREKAKELADGRIFTGRQAMELGLVDEMGNFYDALAYTANMAALPTDNTPVKEYGESVPWQRIFSAELRNKLLQILINEIPDSETKVMTETEVPYVR